MNSDTKETHRIGLLAFTAAARDTSMENAMLRLDPHAAEWKRVHAVRQGYRGKLGSIDCLPNESGEPSPMFVPA